jgi:hypothetical protein
MIHDLLSEFDSKYKMTKEEFQKNVQERFEYFMNVSVMLNKMETDALLKYNNHKYRLGVNIEDTTNILPVSPYAQILEIILGQTDFIKKQTDIVKFTNLFLRQANTDWVMEDTHWMYCGKTNVKLMPTWKFSLANAFLVEGTEGYIDYLEQVKSKFGIMDEGGDWWCDKHSGWPICKLEFDVEEGYEEGFKVSSRSVMETDAGNKIVSALSEQKIVYDTLENRTISNMVNTMSIAMGIHMETQKEFVINTVLDSIRSTVESESDYKIKVREFAEKGRKAPPYKDFYNTAMLYYTLGAFLIALQTSIPSVKTRKTHPGCVRSFSGFPFEGTGDYSSIEYISCVAYDIRSSGEPWNVLKSKKIDVVINKLKSVINEVLLTLPDVKRKMEEKTAYLLTTDAETIPEELDIAQWKQFLPPLVNFKITHLINISGEFKKYLLSDLRNGTVNQRDKILVVQSKIIQFSLALIERIQETVKKNGLLLQSSNNEPYIENACCQGNRKETTIDFFVQKDSRITEYNEIVTQLSYMMDDIYSYSKSSVFFSVENTKNIYPSIFSEFSEKTIYLAFIYFCKFKSLAPIPEDLLPFCTDKPSQELINPSDSIERIIQKLKEDGRSFKKEQFLRLLQIIGKNNIINVSLHKYDTSTLTKLTKILEEIDDTDDDEVFEKSLRTLILKSLDSYEFASTEYTKEVRELNNFLSKHIDDMKAEIVDFVRKNSGNKISKRTIEKMSSSVRKLFEWSADSSERNKYSKISKDVLYQSTQFYKNFIHNFVRIFPNIILNNVNYDDIFIPNYFKFSSTHSNKLKKYISKYYEGFKPFYKMTSLSPILIQIQRSCKNLLLVAENTPSFTSVQYGEETIKPVFDERTSRFLFEYYLLRVLINYIELSEDEAMLALSRTNQDSEIELNDVFTVEHTEDVETRTDLSTTYHSRKDKYLFNGNQKELKQNVSELLICFINIMYDEKETTDVSYEEIQDRVFKLREKEKDLVTDRLKRMTDEERNADTILKINKLGMYSKGMEKGLTTFDKDFYDEEREFRDEMATAERNIRKKNNAANDDNMDILLGEYVEESSSAKYIDDEANDMSYITEEYYNGNTDGVGSPEEEDVDYETEY